MSYLSAPAGSEILLQGNQAIARGALEAGVSWASGYPGNPSSEILETLIEHQSPGKLYVEWSVNEKVGLEAAAAASLTGLRALATMKQNGVNVCLDSLTTLAMTGVIGGLVLVSADDPSGISSTNEEDSRFAAPLAHIPLFEPSSPQEALEMTRYAFELSEKIGNICMVRSLSRVSHTRANVRIGELPEERPKPRFDTSEPFHQFPVAGKHQAMYDKLAEAGEMFEKSPFNAFEGPEESDLLIIACGSGCLYAREALEISGLSDSVGLLKIGTTFPLPEKIVLKGLSSTKQVLFLEEVDPLLEKRVKALAAQKGKDLGLKEFFGKESGHIPLVGELSPDIVLTALAGITGRDFSTRSKSYVEKAGEIADQLVPPREFGFCPGCPHRASYWAIKNALALDDRNGFVSGDIGCYTMGIWPTGFNQVKSVYSMGAGLGLSSGFGKLESLGFEQPVVSVVGDSTFFHAAIPALINAAYNQSSYVLVVLDNAATAMTGFQPHPGTGFSAGGEEVGQIEIEDVCESLGLNVTIVDPYDLEEAQNAVLAGLKKSDKVEVVIFRRTCALVQGRADGFEYKMRIDHFLCRGESCGCNRYCNRVFRCPGLIWDEKNEVAGIDEVVCIGCGVCEQICPAGAIVKEKA